MALNKGKFGTVFYAAATTALIVLPLAGCRFKTPDIREQQELALRGSFAGGTPAWTAVSNKGVGSIGRDSSGFLPESYTADLSGTTISPVYQTIGNEERAQELKEQKVQAAAAARSAAEKNQQGPLDRIAQACPGTESEVNAALTTTEAPVRLEKYVALTRKCSSSADLWIWTGKEYMAAQKYGEAAKSFDQALVLNPQNAEAAGLLTEVRKAQNRAAAPAAAPNK